MEKEDVPLQFRSWIVKFTSEKESCMETEEEKGSMFKEALQRVRLGPQHRFSKDPRKAAFAAGECCDACIQERKRNDHCDCTLFIGN